MEQARYYIKRLWWVGLLVLAIIIAVAIAVISSSSNRNANVDISVVPGDAKITVNNQPRKAGKAALEPGTYEIKAEREGFASSTQKIALGTTMQQVAFALTPVSEEAKDWANDHQQEYADAEARGSQAAQQQGQALIDKYPLISKLPYDASYYEINYAVENKDKNTYYIRIDSTSPMGRQVAIQQIRQWGYEPTDYKIIFPGLANPLDPTTEEITGE